MSRKEGKRCEDVICRARTSNRLELVEVLVGSMVAIQKQNVEGRFWPTLNDAGTMRARKNNTPWAMRKEWRVPLVAWTKSEERERKREQREYRDKKKEKKERKKRNAFPLRSSLLRSLMEPARRKEGILKDILRD